MHAKHTAVLAADGDPKQLYRMCRSLQGEGYTVLRAQDGLHALEQVVLSHPHLAILDTQLPKLNGFDVCSQVREFSTIPMIVLTASGQESDRVSSLDLGADDALTKPFAMDELLARIRSVLRRVQMSDVTDIRTLRATVIIGELMVDCGRELVTMAGRPVKLSALEYRLLVVLTRQLGRVVSREVLLEQVWGEHCRGETNVLQVTINRLRYKLEPDPARPCYLRTKPGVGYLLCSPYERTVSR